MTVKIGITGGIGSGKSVVSRLFELMGVPVYVSDVESKHLTVSNPYIRKKLTALLGKKVYQNGELNKSLLASYLFENEEQAETINRIIHPQVKMDFRKWVDVHSHYPILAMESAILIESGFAGEVDVTVMVYAPVNIRLARAVKRDASSRELILKRIQSQMDDEEKKKFADYIILNDDVTPLIPQIEFLLANFKK
ncbi:Dephospho-CoA kinase [termite gut metagenome]|uniref:Dephospho-CoA kinase n=1 Tax=termite gut metagenome TaxID=433724 RepID=A0A5J4SN65_9ZZZZ